MMSRYVIHSVEGNRQRLDGGAMFGNVPRALWEQWVAPDERNRIELATRAFLIHDREQQRRILLEAGIGVFFEPKLLDRFGVFEPGHQLLINLARLDVAPEDVDLVVLSHLHFDHAGGMLSPWSPDSPPELVFPRARVITGASHWRRARAPHYRDRASFIPTLHRLLEDSGRLELADDERCETLGPDFVLHYSHGHTPGLMLAELATSAGRVVFCGDLVPGRPWVHLPVTMGYDRYPELLVDEKQRLLDHCLEHDTRLLFTHDAGCAMCTVTQDDAGRHGTADERAAVDGLQL